MNAASRRVALVTGASRGIGAAIARRLARDGLAVVVNYVSQRADAEAVVQEIIATGGEAAALQADVSDAAAVTRLFDATVQQFGGLDVLVSNAGIMKVVPIAQMDDATFDGMIAINLKGTFNTLREAAKRLCSGGRIINLSSTVTRLLPPGYGPYAATKNAVEALTMVLARELRGRQITVNAVAPGPTATELFLDGKSDELVASLAKLPPMERLGEASDIAAVVSMLAGPDGAWINGQTLFANGGTA